MAGMSSAVKEYGHQSGLVDRITQWTLGGNSLARRIHWQPSIRPQFRLTRLDQWLSDALVLRARQRFRNPSPVAFAMRDNC